MSSTQNLSWARRQNPAAVTAVSSSSVSPFCASPLCQTGGAPPLRPTEAGHRQARRSKCRERCLKRQICQGRHRQSAAAPALTAAGKPPPSASEPMPRCLTAAQRLNVPAPGVGGAGRWPARRVTRRPSPRLAALAGDAGLPDLILAHPRRGCCSLRPRRGPGGSEKANVDGLPRSGPPGGTLLGWPRRPGVSLAGLA